MEILSIATIFLAPPFRLLTTVIICLINSVFRPFFILSSVVSYSSYFFLVLSISNFNANGCLHIHKLIQKRFHLCLKLDVPSCTTVLSVLEESICINLQRLLYYMGVKLGVLFLGNSTDKLLEKISWPSRENMIE